MREFQRCVEEVNLTRGGGGFLKLDLTTIQNATYMMLESVIKYHSEFSKLAYCDRNYKFYPTNEEWERA